MGCESFKIPPSVAHPAGACGNAIGDVCSCKQIATFVENAKSDLSKMKKLKIKVNGW